jgi:hypothetical protein
MLFLCLLNVEKNYVYVTNACCRLEIKNSSILKKNNSLLLVKLKVGRGDTSDNPHSNPVLCVRGKERFSQSYVSSFGYHQET